MSAHPMKVERVANRRRLIGGSDARMIASSKASYVST
jgi:hypothetical protein